MITRALDRLVVNRVRQNRNRVGAGKIYARVIPDAHIVGRAALRTLADVHTIRRQIRFQPALIAGSSTVEKVTELPDRLFPRRSDLRSPT